MTDVAYGMWPLVVLNTVLFAVLTAIFLYPHSGRDWRAVAVGDLR